MGVVGTRLKYTEQSSY